jgi:hypothetical protein
LREGAEGGEDARSRRGGVSESVETRLWREGKRDDAGGASPPTPLDPADPQPFEFSFPRQRKARTNPHWCSNWPNCCRLTATQGASRRERKEHAFIVLIVRRGRAGDG